MNKNYKRYTPSGEEYQEYLKLGVTYLKDDEDNDWYETLKDIDSAQGYVIFDSNNTVLVIETDPSKLWPENFNFGLVNTSPDDFNFPDDGKIYIYTEDDKTISEKVYSTEELKSKATAVIKVKINEALTALSPLQYAVDLEIATESEKELLTLYKKYIVELNRIPEQSTYPENITYPTEPGLQTT